jgi:hypothetical protein
VHRVGQDLPGDEILHVQVALPPADRVLRPRQVATVGADLEPARVVVVVSLRARVLVEENLVGRRDRALLAHVNRELLLRLPPLDVPPPALEFGRALVALRDPRRHLREQRALEWPHALHRRARIPILRLEVREHLGVLARVVAQPEVRIVTRPMRRRDVVRLLRRARLRRTDVRPARARARGEHERGGASGRSDERVAREHRAQRICSAQSLLSREQRVLTSEPNRRNQT